MFLLAPFAQALSGLLLLAGALLRGLSGDGTGLLLGLGGLALSWVGGLLLGTFLSLAGGHGLRHMGKAILLFPLFTASWMPLQVISLFHDTKRWHVITHLGTASPAAARAA